MSDKDKQEEEEQKPLLPEDVPEGSKVSKMPEGDYTIHVLVQSARNLILFEEDSADPIVFVYFHDQVAQTTAKEHIARNTTVKYDEHLFLEINGIKAADMEQAKIKIEVMNKGFFRNDQIGQFEIPANTIYNMKDHTMLDQLVGVSNHKDNQGQRITGTVALSINVQGPGDQAQELKMASEATLNKKPPLMPASIKKKYRQAHFRFYMAQGLPNMDENIFANLVNVETATDAYIRIKYGQITLKTSIVKANQDGACEWHEELMIPIELPLQQEYIQIEVWDYDFGSRDDIISSYRFPVKQLLKFDATVERNEEDEESDQVNDNTKRENKTDSNLHMLEWIDLYGGPPGYDNAVYNYMNENPNQASHWAGRILVEYWNVRTKFPKMKQFKIDKSIYNEVSRQFLLKKKYQIVFQLMSAINLPDEQKYKVRLQLGHRKWTSGEPMQTKKEYARWNFQVDEQWVDTISMLEKMPDFFVYLLDEDDVPICFFRDKIARFTLEEDTPLEWLFFQADQAVDKVKQLHKAGCFSLRMHIRDIDEQGPFNPKTRPNWKRGMPRRNDPHKLRVAIYQCQSLPPADSEGTSDPYVQIWSSDPNKKVQTQVNYDTNNPIYYELKQTNLEIPPNMNDAPPIQLEVYDKDEDDEDQYLGRANIFLKDLKGDELSRGDRIPKPAWYPVKFADDDHWDPKFGARILCSFCLLDFDMKPALPADKIELDRVFDIGVDQNGDPVPYPMPNLDFQEFQVEINVLGLRELKPEGILPIHKAYVKFKLKSMLKNEMSRAVNDITTLPTETGSNPNIKKTLSFEMELPSKTLYVPRMTCEVFDQLYFAGLAQPQIGSFELNIGQARADGVKHDEELIQGLRRSLAILREARKRIQDSKQESRAGEALRFAQILDDVEIELEDKGVIEKELSPDAIDILEGLGDAFDFRDDTLWRDKKQSAEDQFRVLRDAKEMLNYTMHVGFREPDPEELAKREKRKQNKEDREKAIEDRLLAIEADREKTEAQRNEDQQKLQDTKDGFNNVIFAKYKFDERLKVDVERDIPPASLYAPIGYNKTSKDGKKHYRRYYNHPLEELVTSPFLAVPIYRAVAKPKNGGTGAFGFFKGLLGGSAPPDELQADTLTEVGHLKAKLGVYNKELKLKRTQQSKELLGELRDEIEKCYNIEASAWSRLGRGFPHHLWDKMDPDKHDVNYDTIKTSISKLQELCVQAGLGMLQLESQIGEIISEQYLINTLRTEVNCRIRLYILNGVNFEKRDLFSESDPYLIIRSGKTEFNERENYKIDTANPVFNKAFEIMEKFPGSHALEIEAWDYDEFFGDDQIGSTIIDLDDRYFSREWQAIDDKPIEYRELEHYSSNRSQGLIKLWLEIDEQNSSKFNAPLINIDSEPVKYYEARVVVWHTENLKEMDFEGCTDAYFTCYFDSTQTQSTDTHWRCSTGKASFNWRMKFKLESLKPDYILTVQGWDRDLVTSDELIGAFQLPVGLMFRDCYLTDRQFHMSYDYWESYMKKELISQGRQDVVDKIEFDSTDKQEEKFWVPIVGYDEEQKKDTENGRALISIYITTQEVADKNPLGSGRENVNNDPYLPQPEGRIEFSLNPFTLLGQLIPEKFRRKILCYLYLIFCIALIIYMAPMIASNGLSKLIFG